MFLNPDVDGYTKP